MEERQQRNQKTREGSQEGVGVRIAVLRYQHCFALFSVTSLLRSLFEHNKRRQKDSVSGLRRSRNFDQAETVSEAGEANVTNLSKLADESGLCHREITSNEHLIMVVEIRNSSTGGLDENTVLVKAVLALTGGLLFVRA